MSTFLDLQLYKNYEAISYLKQVACQLLPPKDTLFIKEMNSQYLQFSFAFSVFSCNFAS